MSFQTCYHTRFDFITKVLNEWITNFEKSLTISVWDGLIFQVNLNDIHKIENLNTSISVNVFVYEDLIYLREINNCERRNVVNLLLISVDTR